MRINLFSACNYNAWSGRRLLRPACCVPRFWGTQQAASLQLGVRAPFKSNGEDIGRAGA